MNHWHYIERKSQTRTSEYRALVAFIPLGISTPSTSLLRGRMTAEESDTEARPTWESQLTLSRFSAQPLRCSLS